ncbi:ABC transporter substrate-binding protein [Paenibacillus sepulcri]|uniref:Probable sugar-binding periplasmic protein n=1 Tax=Paenibacillus sepulcri TaxID=359917 RepID=A0ABS7BYZ9_9BACL|nr:extracellular solute-binding protein [Paenibacillus sepulcri]
MKKAWSIVLSTALSVGLLAGCGSGGGTNNNTNGAADGGNANAGKPKSVTLKFFIGQPRFKQQYEGYINDFVAKEKAEKNVDIKVQLEMPNSDNAPQILKTRMASNDAPDIFSLHAVNEAPSFYKAGYLEDLTNQPLADKLLDSVKPSVTIDNKIVAVPMESLAWGFLYNKKIFADNGITPPTTLTEMKAIVEKLKAKKITPFLLSYQEAWIPQLFLPLSVGALVSTDHKDFIDKMNKDEGSFAEMKDMFNIIDLVNANGTDKAMEVNGDDGAAAFAAGKAAMWIQGPWFADTILKSKADFDFGVAPLPVNDNPDATRIDLSTSTALAVSPSSKNKEYALDFLNYVLDDKTSSAFYESLKFNPVAKSHTFETYPWVNDAMVYVKDGKSYQDPVMPQAVKDEVGKALQSYFVKQMSQDDVIKALDKAWKDFNKVNK